MLHISATYKVTTHHELVALFLTYSSDRVLKLSPQWQNLVASTLSVNLMLRALSVDCPIEVIYTIPDNLTL